MPGLAGRAVLSPSKASAWEPTDIAGCRLWLKADDLGLADDDLVSSWTDSGPNGYTPTASGVNRPTYKTGIQNGLPIVRFDGGSDQMAFPSTAATMMGSSAAGTFFAVLKNDIDTGTARGAPFGHWGSNASSDHLPFSDGNIYSGLGSTARKNCGNPSSTLIAWRPHCVITAASNFRYYIEGGTAFFSTGTNTVGWSTSAPSMGKSVGSYWFDGDLGEAIVYDTALSAADLNIVGDYLASKWAVTWNSV